MAIRMNRRAFMGSALAAGAGAILTRPSGIIAAEAPAAFRFVHLTDIHIQPELSADKGFAACLAAVEKLDPKPDFIITGGDLVMDASDTPRERSLALFDLYKKVGAGSTGVPFHNAVGNHDVLGWSNKQGIAATDPLYGKKLICDRLGMEKTYYAFDHKGWRFYVLDDIQPNGTGYQAYIDDEQLAWLKSDLAAKPKSVPAAVVCHIPILSVTVFNDNKPGFGEGAYHIPISGMCRGTRELTDLFAANNVRLALSGHIHQQDRIETRGVTFICDGAVCGSWWKGPNDGTQEGFGIIDAAPDGGFKHQYFDYGWEAKA